MKHFFTLLLVAGLISGLTSCGEAETAGASSLPYYISIADADGKDIMTDGKRCNFAGDGISGNVDFGFDKGKLSLLDCWNKVGEGVSALEGQTFKGAVTVNDYTVEDVDVTITKVTETKGDDMGANYDLTGTIAGGTKGKFNVSVFKMK